MALQERVKSVFGEVLCAILGPYAAKFEMCDFKDRFERGRLGSYHLLMANEVDGFLPEANLKDVTGPGKIKDRKLYHEAVDVDKTAKLLFCSNGFKVKDSTGALLDDRILMTSWNNRKRGTDEEVKDFASVLVKEEAPQIFNDFLMGLDDLITEDQFEETSSAKELKKEIKRSTNPSLGFIEIQLENDSRGFMSNVELSSLYDSYRDSSRKAGEYVVSLKEFKDSICCHFTANISKQKGIRGIIGVKFRESLSKEVVSPEVPY